MTAGTTFSTVSWCILGNSQAPAHSRFTQSCCHRVSEKSGAARQISDRNPSHGGAVFRLSERINPLQISTADGTQSDPLRRCLRLNETESCHSETTGTFAVWRLGWSVPVPLRTWHAWAVAVGVAPRVGTVLLGFVPVSTVYSCTHTTRHSRSSGILTSIKLPEPPDVRAVTR